MAEGFCEKDVIFTTNFSFFATTEVISLVGATPVFVDIDRKTFNIDPDGLLHISATENISGKEVKGAGKDSMRAVGVLCLQLFGEGKTPEIKDEIKAITIWDYQNLSWKTPRLYSWYYATQAMFQHGGKDWKLWNKRFQKELNDNQHPEGYWEDPGQKLKGLDNKVYATTLCALMLTVYYRYLPSSKGGIIGQAAKKKTPVIEAEEGLNLID